VKRDMNIATIVRVALVVAVAAGVWVLLTGSAAAPTTQGLILQAVGYAGTAAVGNGNDAYAIVSVYNEAGPVRGLASGSLSIAIAAAPADAPPVHKTGVVETSSGIYRIGLAPELSSQRWVSGTYVIGITLTSADGSGVAVADFAIGP
jgi:hypothetical protein